MEVECFASFVIKRKLKFVKEELKKWNKEVFRDIKLRKYKLLDSVDALDVKEKSDGLSSDEIDQRREAREELARVLHMEEVSWRQKSRALWLRKGNHKTKFFHKTTNLRRKFNFMSGVEIEGNRYETVESMKSSIHGFYKKLFSKTECWRSKVEGLSLPSLSNSAREVLEMSFDEEEVIRALHDCYGDKAPGLDRITMAFLQANWDTV